MRYGIKRRAALLLTLVMVLGLLLTACGGGKKADIAGRYVGNFDMTDLLNQQTDASAIHFNSKVAADFFLTLNEDNTCVLDIDADSLVTSISEAVQNEIDSIIGGIMGQEVTEDSAEEIANAAGYDSYDQFKEDILNKLKESLDQDAVANLTDSCHIEGTYAVKGKDLELSAEDTEQFSVKVGTIQDDGSILLDIDANDQKMQITFVKQ